MSGSIQDTPYIRMLLPDQTRALKEEGSSSCAGSSAEGGKPDLTRPKTGKARSVHRKVCGNVKKPVLTKSKTNKGLPEHDNP